MPIQTSHYTLYNICNFCEIYPWGGVLLPWKGPGVFYTLAPSLAPLPCTPPLPRMLCFYFLVLKLELNSTFPN